MPVTKNISDFERWASLAGGVLLTGYGLRARGGNKLLAVLGAELMRRGATGHCYAYQALRIPSHRISEGVRARAAVTIGKPRQEIYQFWRDFQNLPRIMKHLHAVRIESPTGSHWIARGPAGGNLEWDAEIQTDIKNELIAWRSLPGADVDTAGSVQFKDAPGGRGTEVLVKLQYNPPTGMVAATILKLFGRDAETEIESDLFRFKQYLECGELAETEGQPRGPSVLGRGLLIPEEGRKAKFPEEKAMV